MNLYIQDPNSEERIPLFPTREEVRPAFWVIFLAIQLYDFGSEILPKVYHGVLSCPLFYCL
ncbi:MAG: hypothetical protein ACK4LB_02210 [Spirosomataceae bacterium]